MKTQIYHGLFFRVNTSSGTEIVTCDDVGRTMNVDVSALLNRLDGTPDDPDEMCEVQSGWLARMAMPGYLDCTDWTAHASEAAASAYLDEMYGDDV